MRLFATGTLPGRSIRVSTLSRSVASWRSMDCFMTFALRWGFILTTLLWRAMRHAIIGYADGHFENWGVMTTACVRIAKRRGLDPKEQKGRSPFQRTSKYVQGTSSSESEGERLAIARRRNGGWRFEAKLADQSGDTRERPPMLCTALPYQTL